MTFWSKYFLIIWMNTQNLALVVYREMGFRCTLHFYSLWCRRIFINSFCIFCSFTDRYNSDESEKGEGVSYVDGNLLKLVKTANIPKKGLLDSRFLHSVRVIIFKLSWVAWNAPGNTFSCHLKCHAMQCKWKVQLPSFVRHQTASNPFLIQHLSDCWIDEMTELSREIWLAYWTFNIKASMKRCDNTIKGWNDWTSIICYSSQENGISNFH